MLSNSLREPSKFKINTQFFSPHDLNLFLESLDTISRLTKEKHEKQEQQKVATLKSISRKYNTLSRIGSESSLNSSRTIPSSEEGDDELMMLLEVKKVPKTPDSQRSEAEDGAYFSAPSSNQSSPRNSVMYSKETSRCSSPFFTSDSDESGVFPIGESNSNICASLENTPMRPRSKVITKTRSISKRSRLIGLVRKKEAKKTPTVQLLSHRALGEYETLNIYEEERNKTQKYAECGATQETDDAETSSRFATLHMRKKSRRGFAYSDGSAEECFLGKALRYLTL